MQGTMESPLGANLSGANQLAQDSPTSIPQDGMILIRVHSRAFDPRDINKEVDYDSSITATPEILNGSYAFAGIVTKLSQGVTRFQVGDRVLAYSSSPTSLDKSQESAFAEFALVEQDGSCHIPNGMEFDDACSISIGLAAANQLSFMNGTTNDKDNVNTPVLVSGGATPSGIMATQLLKMAGYTPIVTCSPAENSLCQENGAAMCFEINSPACGADIRVHTDNGLVYALDCIADDVSMKMCYEAIGSGSGSASGSAYYFGLGRPGNAIAIKYTRRDVEAVWTLADGYQVLGSKPVDSSAALEDVKTGRVHVTEKLIVPLEA